MDLQSWLHTLTIAPFGLVFIQQQNRITSTIFAAITTSTICTILLIYPVTVHHLLPPLLSLTLLIWTSLPGSFADIQHLPSHSTFMRSLVIIQRRQDEDDCKICWTSTSPLALLPCDHKACTTCLRTMGTYFQTACPQCRRPLFGTYDRLVFVVSKGSVVCAATNFILFTLQAILELRQGKGMWDLAVTIGSLWGLGGYLSCIWRLVGAFGGNWWRGAPGETNWMKGSGTPVMACVAFGTGLGLLVQTVGVSGRMLREVV